MIIKEFSMIVKEFSMIVKKGFDLYVNSSNRQYTYTNYCQYICTAFYTTYSTSAVCRFCSATFQLSLGKTISAKKPVGSYTFILSI